MKVIPFFIIFVETIRDMKDLLILAWAITMGLMMSYTLKKK